MSNAKTRAIRSHRSKRSYKPVSKAFRHTAAKKRKNIRKFIGLATEGKAAFDKLLSGM